MAKQLDNAFSNRNETVANRVAQTIEQRARFYPDRKLQLGEIAAEIMRAIYDSLNEFRRDKPITECNFLVRTTQTVANTKSKHRMELFLNQNGEMYIPGSYTYESGEGVSGSILEKPISRIIFDLDDVTENARPTTSSTVSMLVVPITDTDGQCIAQVTVDSNRKGTFCAYDRHFVEAVVQKVQRFIQVSVEQGLAQWQTDATRTYESQELSLFAAASDLLEGGDIENVLRQIAIHARIIVNADVSFVALLKADDKTVRIVAMDAKNRTYNIDNIDLSLAPEKVKGQHKGLVGEVIENSGLKPEELQPELWNDVLTISQQRPDVDYVPIEGIHAELVVPIYPRNKRLTAGEHTIGALCVGSSNKNAFTERHKRILEQFGREAGTIIHRHKYPKYSLEDLSDKWEVECDIFLALPFAPEWRCKQLTMLVQEASQAVGRTAQNLDADKVLHSALWEHIVRCKLLVADVSIVGERTVPNPNVMYELGLAVGQSKPVILITQSEHPEKELPADLGGLIALRSPGLDANTPLPEKERTEFVNKLAERIKLKLAIR